MPVTIESICKKTGWSRDTSPLALVEDLALGDNAGQVLMLVTWSEEYLSLSIDSRRQRSTSDIRIYEQEMNRLGLGQLLDGEIVSGKKRFAMISLDNNADFVLECRLNTDSVAIANLPVIAPANLPALRIGLDINIYGKEEKLWRNLYPNDHKVPLRLDLYINRIRELPKQTKGCAAVDLGSTNSCIAFLPDDFTSVQDIEVVDCSHDYENSAYRPGTNKRESIPTLLRILSVEEGVSNDGVSRAFAKASTLHGDLVFEDDQGHLVLGIKRFLAHPDFTNAISLQLPQQDMCEVGKDFPAELFLAKVIKCFHAEKVFRLKPVAITFPATYTRREIERTKAAVFRGYLRALLNRILSPIDEARLLNQQVRLEIDEASAAAFYFIYRDFIKGPGHTQGFLYAYPQGITLLLYDCGGGTTDVSLVKVTPRPKARDGAPDAIEVDVKVLGTTGHRHFGGDNVTAAFFQVLKTFIAKRMAQEVKRPFPSLPSLPAEWSQWLARSYKECHRFIPTNTDPGSLAQLTRRDRRLRIQARNAFWGYCEHLKIHLSEKPKEAIIATDARLETLARLIAEQAGIQLRDKTIEEVISAAVTEDFLKLGAKQCVGVEAVNTLLKPDIDKTVLAANRLIDSKLHEGSSKIGAVDWIYLVGRSARYPAITDAVSKNLNIVPWLMPNRKLSMERPSDRLRKYLQDIPDDESAFHGVEPPSRISLDTNNLKSSVVQGAVLALGFKLNLSDVSVKQDDQVARKLPFDVGWNSIKKGPTTIYEEGTVYEMLKEEEIDIVELVAPTTEQSAVGVESSFPLYLYRLWPGDKATARSSDNIMDWEKYLVFEFTKRPAGKVRIYFDDKIDIQKQSGFFAKDETNGKVYDGIEISSDEGLGPLEKGDL